MTKKNKIKTLIFLSITIGLVSYLSYDHEYHEEYSINEYDNGPFGRYKKGNIYIGDREYILSILSQVNPGDVLIEQGYKVEDGNYDPNYKIYSSYQITDKDDRNDILNVLLLYNKVNNWELDRTIESMRVEWTVHNLLYGLGLYQDRTRDVDLNNEDEETFGNPLLKRIIK